MSTSHDLAMFEPSDEAMALAKETERQATERDAQSKIFDHSVVHLAKTCSCGKCCDSPIGTRPNYCCASLWSMSESLTSYGRTMKDQLSKALSLPYGMPPLHCITPRRREELHEDDEGTTRSEYLSRKREERQDTDWDRTTVQRTGTVTYPEQKKKYAIVDVICLAEAFLWCVRGCGETCAVRVITEGPITNIRAKCEACSQERKWTSSPLLKTKAEGKYEQLHEINMDIVSSAMSTTYGYGAVAPFMKTLGCSFPSSTCFNDIKRRYLEPAVDALYTALQKRVIAMGEELLRKGEKLFTSGDAQFDTRGFSAIWARYVMTLNQTGLILTFANVSKKLEGTHSQALEMIGLIRCLDEVLEFYKDHPNPIARLTTDRHRQVIKMMPKNYPAIEHRFDPWHFCRNVLLALITEGNKKTRKSLVPWIPYVNNHIWWSITSSTDPLEVKEKYLSILYHVRGIHDWQQDKSFKLFHGCAHSACSARNIDLDAKSQGYKALDKLIKTPSYLNAIGSVSPDLGTAQIEGYNHIATLHEPKDRYFGLEGHDLRTKIGIIRHNSSQFDTLAGLREPSIKRRYYHKTLKCYKDRLIRPPPVHKWREQLTQEMYNIRRNLESADKKQWKSTAHLSAPATPSTSLAAVSLDDDVIVEDDENNEESTEAREVLTISDRLMIHSMLEFDSFPYSEDDSDHE